MKFWEIATVAGILRDSQLSNQVTPMARFREQKLLVREHHARMDAAGAGEVQQVLESSVPLDYRFRCVHPFGVLEGPGEVGESFWAPLKTSFTNLQRRPDIFFAGQNEIDGFETEWVCSMGHLMGLFDQPWLGIQPTGKLLFFRYAEFNRLELGQIVETGFFCDILSVMQQAGLNPLPNQTGAFIVSPGPRTHDGLLYSDEPPAEGKQTLALINQLISDLTQDYDEAPESRLARCWRKDMAWYGPAGIGATFTRDRYRQQHQDPFRSGLKDIAFQGHVCRIAEGHYGGFFGWPNLTMKPAGGFLGLPDSDRISEMRVVDIYRREGSKLAENWVFIDLLHFLHGLGVDLLPG